MISFAVTAKLICVFVFAYAKSQFSHNEAQIILGAKSRPDNECILTLTVPGILFTSMHCRLRFFFVFFYKLSAFLRSAMMIKFVFGSNSPDSLSL